MSRGLSERQGHDLTDSIGEDVFECYLCGGLTVCTSEYLVVADIWRKQIFRPV